MCVADLCVRALWKKKKVDLSVTDQKQKNFWYILLFSSDQHSAVLCLSFGILFLCFLVVVKDCIHIYLAMTSREAIDGWQRCPPQKKTFFPVISKQKRGRCVYVQLSICIYNQCLQLSWSLNPVRYHASSIGQDNRERISCPGQLIRV